MAISSGHYAKEPHRLSRTIFDNFTETGIQLKSGKTLEADIMVTATGLELLAMGGMQIEVDGKSHRYFRHRSVQRNDA